MASFASSAATLLAQIKQIMNPEEKDNTSARDHIPVSQRASVLPYPPDPAGTLSDKQRRVAKTQLRIFQGLPLPFQRFLRLLGPAVGVKIHPATLVRAEAAGHDRFTLKGYLNQSTLRAQAKYVGRYLIPRWLLPTLETLMGHIADQPGWHEVHLEQIVDPGTSAYAAAAVNFCFLQHEFTKSTQAQAWINSHSTQVISLAAQNVLQQFKAPPRASCLGRRCK